MHLDASAQPHPPALQDEDLAGRSTARLLITALVPEAVESLARRIHHGASSRAGCPFVPIRATDLPLEPRRLRETCSEVLDAAAGSTVLIVDVEEMAPIVQDVLIDLLAELESARAPSAAVRLIFGTTVSLLDRVSADAFSKRLFYRLNVIHLMTMPVAAGMTPA